MDEQRKIDKLYELLEEKERKKDAEAAVALSGQYSSWRTGGESEDGQV